MNRQQETNNTSAPGFTIVELMIATSVFAIILLIMTFSLLQVGRTYYKGLTTSRTQSAARSIMDQIAQAIQFSGGVVTDTVGKDTPGTTYAFCINTTRYSYVLDAEITDGTADYVNKHTTNHALVVDTPAGGCDASTPPAYPDLIAVGSNGLISSGPQTQTELLGPFMRLATLDIEPSANPVNIDPQHPILYEITIRVVYGDDDLLNSDHNLCVGGAGSQFCSISELSTVVQKRLP